MEESTYIAYLKMVGWKLSKAGIDYSLFDENGMYVCTIKISHGKGKKREVIAPHVQKTEKKFREKGLNGLRKRNQKALEYSSPGNRRDQASIY